VNENRYATVKKKLRERIVEVIAESIGGSPLSS
jgi:hypothetical protein